ncbi:branched-chain amino acid ABC transporter permease [Ornithinimicrobium cryptoxanthini]|uniref:Branched-chain amino acid ABC transporter permease n=1 Tax=Ornithinimicrobium cryptoxanthini TaxID=2934161 RepID=A0ABY4YN11_9MICO|nr:branched-chain amino acid ABC transporter permease [Ornithinimicrobium cryptoxanthini]USQ77660.1 branched-chain amino acid ABC transporter permease [Ornithinimicrobium cryptoxanthini]
MTAVDTQRPEGDQIVRDQQPSTDLRARLTGLIVPVGLVVLLACLPLLNLSVPGVLPGATYTPGTLHMLALAMVMAGLALSYHLLFGVAGLLSFGHALYFGLGAYGVGIVMEKLELGIVPSAILIIVAGIVISTLLGAVSLQVTGIPFAMVTLAFAQAGFVLVRKDPGRLTGGEEGMRLPTDYVPDWLVGVADTRNLYWVALAALVVAFVVVTWVQRSRAGHVAEAVRENELRVQVLGMRPFLVKLAIFVAASVIAMGMGMVHLLLNSGAVPHILSAELTISLLLMVVLGGVGSRWGAVAGAFVYVILSQRLAVLAQSPTISDLPAVLRIPLSEPMFILGAIFVLVVMFLPGGLAGLGRRVQALFSRRAAADLKDDNRTPEDLVEEDQTP